MRILLVQPRIRKCADFPGSSSGQVMEPLTLAVLAGLTPDKHQLEVVDERIEDFNYSADYDLVGISVNTDTARRAYTISEKFNSLGIPVVLGGHHVTLVPGEAINHGDSILVGEAEGIWPKILADCEAGQLKQRYERNHRPDLAESPLPDRGVFREKNYLPIEMVETTRGCPHNCSFCSVSVFFGQQYRHRPIENVISEIKRLDGKLVFFVDDNIIGDPSYAKELFRALVPLDIHWFGQGSLLMARDEELLDLMRESGCLGNLIGIETLNENSLNEVNKSWNLSLSLSEAIKRIHSHGLGIYASFVLGFDGDDAQTVERTFDFARRSKFLAANFNVLTPHPATETYRKLLEEGRLQDDQWWLKDKPCQAHFSPVNFSPAELALKCSWANWKFHSISSMIYRLSNIKPHLRDLLRAGLYFGLNRNLRRQYGRIFNKCRRAVEGSDLES